MTAEVVKLWGRSADAEGNPLHAPFSRVPLHGVVPLTPEGFVGSRDWHRDRQVRERDGAGPNPNDRALLLQTRGNLRHLQEHFPQLAAKFDDKEASDAIFGENVLLDGEGFDSDGLCVGDVLRFQRGDTTVARICITAPRWPCYKIDNVHSKPIKELPRAEQVRGICIGIGWAGFFARVLDEGGSVCVGDTVTIEMSRPRLDWPLSRIAHVFYSGSNQAHGLLKEWQGTQEELETCLHMEELTEFEWRERLREYVAKVKKDAIDLQVQEEKQAQEAKKRKNLITIFSILLCFVAIIIYKFYFS